MITYQRVSVTVASRQSISGRGGSTGGEGVRVSDIKRLKINPDRNCHQIFLFHKSQILK